MNLKDFILLPEGKYGRHEYPDLLIMKRRLAVDERVARVNKRLKNTSLVDDGSSYDYVGNINLQQARGLMKKLGGIPASLILGKEFLHLLRKGIDGAKVYNGEKARVNRKEVARIYDDMTGARNPWRAELFDTTFKDGKIIYPIYRNGAWKQVKEELEDCLMKDRDINITFWLNNSTSQGLPRPEVEGHELIYSFSKDNSVAGFNADSGGAGLVCGWVPSVSGSGLGVRGAICAENRDAPVFDEERYTPSQIHSALKRAGYANAGKKVLDALRE